MAGLKRDWGGRRGQNGGRNWEAGLWGRALNTGKQTEPGKRNEFSPTFVWEGGVDAGDSWGWGRGTLSLGIGRPVDGPVLLLLVCEWQRGSRIVFPSLPRSEQREALGLPWTDGHSQLQVRASCVAPPKPAP